MTVREYTPPTVAELTAERIQIVAALEQFAVVATPRQLDQLQELLDRTGEANSQFNLTAIRDRVKKGRDDPKVCLGVVGFTEADWQRLDGIQGR